MEFSFRPSIFLIGGLLLTVISGCAGELAAQDNSSFPTVALPGTEVRQLTSAATGRDYDIYVKFPENYEIMRAKSYPVLYVLDGQWDFKLLDSIQGGLNYDQFTPDILIVGITYSGDNPDYGALRAKDYTPVFDRSLPGSGDAPQFHTFLKEELIPFIEENYRADPTQRVLMGSSFGGSFTLYALFTEPELFSGYVAASPAVTYGGRAAFGQEADYADTHDDLPARLFISVGEIEMLAQPVQAFIQILSERDYPSLEMETRIIEGERHAGNKPEAFNRGLRYIFQ